MIKYVFFDFNGTIIDDVDLCLELLNKILKSQNKPEVSLEQYREIFTFPIRKYYELAGVDFNIESYESLAIKFIEEYQPASYNCRLFPGIREVVDFLHKNGIKAIILSASEVHNLKDQCEHFNIDTLFDDILGIDNIHAASKVNIAKDYFKAHNATVIVKGLRAMTDFEYEFQMALVNRQLCPNADTLFLTTSAEYMYLSSSVVRQVAKFNGDISQFVPKQILNTIIERLYKKDTEE